MSDRIVYNGKEYNSIEELPLEVREQFRRMYALGPPTARVELPGIVPPLDEGKHTLEVQRSRFVIDGVEYNSLEDMPPEVRKKYESLASLLGDKDGNGVPDIMEGQGSAGILSTAKVLIDHTDSPDFTLLKGRVTSRDPIRKLLWFIILLLLCILGGIAFLLFLLL